MQDRSTLLLQAINSTVSDTITTYVTAATEYP